MESDSFAKIRFLPIGRPSFLDMPRCESLDNLDADVAIIGAPYGTPYDLISSRSIWSTAPDAIREQSLRYGSYFDNYDYDFGGQIFAHKKIKIIDCGDVWMIPGEYEQNRLMTTAVIRAILERGAIPITLGGDHSIPIPVFRAFEGRGPVYIVQIDAHIDWRDDVDGIKEGLSSPMRRASEMPWVKGMSQIGIRGVGSARKVEFDDAEAYGSQIIGAEEVHQRGVKEVLSRIPDSASYYITFDADGLDPSIAPGIRSMTFDGLTYSQASSLLRGIAMKGNIVGFDFVELVPSYDVNNITAFLAARLILNVIGAVAHSGQIGSN